MFFTHKKHPGGASIYEIKESFPLKPSLGRISGRSGVSNWPGIGFSSMNFPLSRPSSLSSTWRKQSMRLLSNHYCLIKIKFLRSFESVPSGFVFRSPACLPPKLCRLQNCHSRLRLQLSLVSKKNVPTKKKEVRWTLIVKISRVWNCYSIFLQLCLDYWMSTSACRACNRLI